MQIGECKTHRESENLLLISMGGGVRGGSL